VVEIALHTEPSAELDIFKVLDGGAGLLHFCDGL
jgi:hypothetical protein